MFGRTALDEWSACRRDLYLTTHNIRNRHPCPHWIRTRNPSKREATDLRLRPRSSRDRLKNAIVQLILFSRVNYTVTGCTTRWVGVHMPAAGKRIFSFPRSPDWLWGPSNPSCSRYSGSSPPGKRSEHELYYSHPSSAHVNHDWSCTSKPVHDFMTRTWTLPSRFDLG